MRDAISSRRACWILVIVFAALSAVGCTTPEMPMESGQIVTSIVNGREARNVPSACLVRGTDSTGRGFGCTGSLVAPNVVLTAGHCVAGATNLRVTCPYAADRTEVRASMASAAPSFMGTAQLTLYGRGDAGSDLGLIRLDRAIAERHVARVAFSQPTRSRLFYAIGRIYHDRSTDAVYDDRINVSPLQSISDIDSQWSRWEGVRAFVTEPGDSGGPIIDNATGNVVGVASAAARTTSDCVGTRVCTFLAMIAPEWVWYTTTVQNYISGLIVPQAPMGCETATSCADCTARASCGWCNGACVSGTVDGGGSCTRAAGSWSWTSQYCTPPESTDLQNTSITVACESATSCGTCTEMAGCGWCNGACVSGDVNGGGECTAAASTWAWLSSECAAPAEDPCAVATDCDACTSMAMCGWCNGACVTGTADGGSTCTATAGDWGWLSSQCPNATTPSDACSGAADCAACTALSGCGWCDGMCLAGDYGGATSATCAAWSWYSFQCM